MVLSCNNIKSKTTLDWYGSFLLGIPDYVLNDDDGNLDENDVTFYEHNIYLKKHFS